MKRRRLLALMLALAMALALTACGGGGEKETAGDQQGSNTPLTREDDTPLTREDSTPSGGDLTGSQGGMTEFDPSDLQSMMESANRNNMTPQQIADLEADAAANGYEIDWNADGSLVIIEDGSAINTAGTWPQNEFTADLPVPGKDMITASEVSEDGCTIMMTWTAEDAKAYAGELKKAGFDRGVEEQDLASMGMYTFSASNGEYTVIAMLAGGSGGIEIEKTDPEELKELEANPSVSTNDEDMQKQLEEAQKQLEDPDLQKQLEEAQKQLEGMDLPEGYEDIMGDLDLGNLDLGALMGGGS